MPVTSCFVRKTVLVAMACVLLTGGARAMQSPAAAQAQEQTLSASNAFPDRLQSITIYGSGWFPGTNIFVLPCPGVTDEADATGDTCDTRTLVPVTISEVGNFQVQVEWFIPAEGLVFAAGSPDNTQGAVGTIVAAVEGQLRASVGQPGIQDVQVFGSEWPAGLAIFLLPCPGVADELDATGDTCDTGDLTPVTSGSDGTFAATVSWDVPPEGLVFVAGDPASTATGVSTVVVDPLRWRTDAKSTLQLDTPGRTIVTAQYRDESGVGLPERLERLAIVASNSSSSRSELSVRFRIRCYDADGAVLVRRGGTTTLAPGERFKRRATVPAGQVSCTVSLRTVGSDSFAGSGVLKIRSLRSAT